MAFRLLGSILRPLSSHSSIGTLFTAGAPKVSSDPLGAFTRAGINSNHAWLAATLTVWPGCGAAPCLDDALPALPGQFVIVPDGDERPTRSRVLPVGIGKVALVDDPIAVDR